MNNTQKIIASTMVIGTTVVFVKTLQSYYNDLYNRFPEYDRKIVRKAWHKMLLNALSGKYPDDLDGYSDAMMDVLFQREYDILSK